MVQEAAEITSDSGGDEDSDEQLKGLKIQKGDGSYFECYFEISPKYFIKGKVIRKIKGFYYVLDEKFQKFE